MAYNKYNTRHSGRFNAPGQFVSAEELVPGAGAAPPAAPPRAQPSRAVTAAAPPPPPPPMFPQPPQPQRNKPSNQNLQMVQTSWPAQTTDVEMKSEAPEEAPPAGEDAVQRPHWMKSKLPGVKKVSNKERRRRQNENLRKLLTPKNALMVLNEMMPNEQLANQFKVEPAAQVNTSQYYSKAQNQHSFCADLTLDGNNYKGYGENKLMARNAAAEQAIRDLIIKRMGKVLAADASGSQNGEEPPAEEAAPDEEALPMIQLASFALHKLFSEWEYEGHKVPQLKPGGHSLSEPAPEAAVAAPSAPKPKAPKKPKDLPVNAAAMHPCMLLTYMRPHMEYRELAVEGDRPQNMCFTLGVDVDGATYIGKATNKKEARKAAAMAACQALFNVRFDSVATANAPVLA